MKTLLEVSLLLCANKEIKISREAQYCEQKQQLFTLKLVCRFPILEVLEYEIVMLAVEIITSLLWTRIISEFQVTHANREVSPNRVLKSGQRTVSSCDVFVSSWNFEQWPNHQFFSTVQQQCGYKSSRRKVTFILRCTSAAASQAHKHEQTHKDKLYAHYA